MTARASASRAALSPAAEWDRLYRLPVGLWRAFLADPATIERYHSKIYRRAGPGCWYWLGAISAAGHGRLRCGTRALEPERPATRVMASHLYGFQLSRGLLRPDPVTGLLPVIRHRCDEASCHRPSHWVTGSTADNAADFTARGKVPGSPLTDRRGATGRAIAIRGAILVGLDRGDSPERIKAAIWSASAAGVPGGQARLFDWPTADAKETTRPTGRLAASSCADRQPALPLSTAHRTPHARPDTLSPRVLSPPPVTVDQAPSRPSHPGIKMIKVMECTQA